MIPASPRPPPATSTITYIDGDKGELLYRGYPIEQLADKSHFLESLLPAALRRTADRDADGRFRKPRDQPHDGARTDALFLPRLPPRCASDGDHGRRGRRDVGLLPRQHRHPRPLAARGRGDPDDRQAARPSRRWPIKYSIGQPFVYPKNALDYAVELPAHVLCRPGRGLRRPAGAGQGDGPHHDAARRPRAERLDLDGAAGGIVGRQPLRLRRGRHRLPLGPGAWRRQPGLPRDAARDRHRRPHPRIHRQRQGQGRSVPPDGLWPPRLQELRPARQGDEGMRRRGARPAGHPQQRDPPGRQGAGADRAGRSTISFRKSSIPNVDFYSGIILEAMGFPTSMFTPIFALSRTVGWITPVEGNDRRPRP